MTSARVTGIAEKVPARSRQVAVAHASRVAAHQPNNVVDRSQRDDITNDTIFKLELTAPASTDEPGNIRLR